MQGDSCINDEELLFVLTQQLNELEQKISFLKNECMVRCKNEAPAIQEEIQNFFINNYPTDNSMFYLIYVSIDELNTLQTRGIYFGGDCSPLSFVVDSEVFLAEAVSKEAVQKFITMKQEDEIFCALNISFENFMVDRINAYYQENEECSLSIFYESDDEYTQPVKIIGA